MIGYGAKELAEAFRTVRKNTIQIAKDIPEPQYDFTAARDTRTVRQMLAHVAASDRWQSMFHEEKRTSFEGLDFPTLMRQAIDDERKPRSKAELIALLQESGDSLATWMETLSDDFLAERVTMPPGAQPSSKTRFEMLLGIKEHEMHHRAQLMLIERIIGIEPHLTRQMRERMAART
jgi:uncharacterized damage-inducible protein DinB